MIKRFSLCVLLIAGLLQQGITQPQPTNTDPAKNYVNVNIPKTPESAGFEKYGDYQVSEFTGTTNISIPLYTLKSRFLAVPITLSYQATGVKVNQESSWVGLGFDLLAGGRVTVETRGTVDFCSATWGLMSPNTQTAMTQIFNHVGNSGENAVYTPATFNDPGIICPGPMCNTSYFNGTGISEITQFGTGEPDIFRANFNGHSVTFYVDKISNNIKFLGELSNFKIAYTLDSYHNITGWTIVDNEGVSYYFNQTETTTNTLPGSAIVPATTTSAWLLTKIEHPSGDNIQFTYNSYGYSVPAFHMSGSIDVVAGGVATISSDQHQNISIQSPYYLTRIESPNVSVDLVLDTRTDLYGPGSRKLNQIKVTDKLSNSIKSTVNFNYSYFQGSVDQSSRNYLNSLQYYLPSTLSKSNYLASSNIRLRLDSVSVSGINNNYPPPYRFYYNTLNGVPDKYTLAKDHWGYFNGITPGGNYSFNYLVPFYGSFGVQNTLPSGSGLSAFNFGNNRDCTPDKLTTLALDSIVYPTGGSTKFVYEPHQSNMLSARQPPYVSVTGGGMRVKLIRNYSAGSIAGIKEYTYSAGKYMGTINYFTTDAGVLAQCPSDIKGHWKYSSDGAVNYNDILIGYGQITVTQKDAAGQTNGSLIKTFNISTPSSNYANGLGYDLKAPIYGPQEQSNVLGWTFVTWLSPVYKNFAPTPSSNLEGKLMHEQYFDNSGKLLKNVSYYYRLGNYTNNYYDVKAIQNRVSAFDPCPSTGTFHNAWGSGLRPVNLFVSPAKSFHILIDSIKEVTYQEGNTIVQKKTFTYDAKYQVKSETINNSDGTANTTSYTRPYDYLASGLNGNTSIIYQMVARNMNTPVFSTRVMKNGVQVDSVFNLYHNPSSGIFVPQNTQIQIAGNPMETRQTYNVYDNFGHLLEKQKPNDVKEVYLWGYNAHFPVAKIVGSDYVTANGIINSSVLNMPANDAALRQELNKLRVNLPNAFVTTYTYDPVFGMTSVTDPNGKTNYYEYDDMGRLALIRDQDNNVVKRFCYNYAGQPENCNYYYNAVQSGSFVRNNCGIGYTGGAATYTIPVGTYGSPISQADADEKALTDVNANGQAYANANGACYSACSFSMFPGYTIPTSSISSSGGVVSFYITFFSSSAMTAGNTYSIATINGSCRPSATRTINYSTGGRSWTITITTGGQMLWKLNTGSPTLNANTTMNTTTLTYNL